LFGQKQPLVSKVLVLFLDETTAMFRDLITFRRVGTEIFGSVLHGDISNWCASAEIKLASYEGEHNAEKLTNLVIHITGRPTFQTISERFSLRQQRRAGPALGHQECHEGEQISTLHRRGGGPGNSYLDSEQFRPAPRTCSS
jgi:hypothetical protein